LSLSFAGQDIDVGGAIQPSLIYETPGVVWTSFRSAAIAAPPAGLDLCQRSDTGSSLVVSFESVAVSAELLHRGDVDSIENEAAHAKHEDAEEGCGVNDSAGRVVHRQVRPLHGENHSGVSRCDAQTTSVRE
jgi:hypothetical protein